MNTSWACVTGREHFFLSAIIKESSINLDAQGLLTWGSPSDSNVPEKAKVSIKNLDDEDRSWNKKGEPYTATCQL